MGLRYYKRIGGNKGFGWNVSGSGISPSYRTKYGAIGTKGFTIRTGIPGLYIRNNWSKKGGTFGVVLFLFMITYYVFYYSIVITYNLIVFLWWILIYIVSFIIGIFDSKKENISYKDNNEEEIKSTDSDIEKWKFENPYKSINEYYKYKKKS